MGRRAEGGKEREVWRGREREIWGVKAEGVREEERCREGRRGRGRERIDELHNFVY